MLTIVVRARKVLGCALFLSFALEICFEVYLCLFDAQVFPNPFQCCLYFPNVPTMCTIIPNFRNLRQKKAESQFSHLAFNLKMRYETVENGKEKFAYER